MTEFLFARDSYLCELEAAIVDMIAGYKSKGRMNKRIEVELGKPDRS